MLGFTERRSQLSTGIEVAWTEEGDPQGPPLLLVMGIRLQMLHWPADFCARLAEHGLRVIRFDNRDSGLSSKLDDLGRPKLRQILPRALLRLPVDAPYSLQDMAGDGLALLDTLGIHDAHIVGVSMGGMIAQVMALAAPQRVRSLSLIMTTAGGVYLPQPAALRAILRKPPSPPSREGHAQAFLEVQQALAGPGETLQEDRDLVLEIGRQAWDRCPEPEAAWFLRQLAAILAAPPRHEKLSGLTVPTRLLHGAQDPLIPPRASLDLASLLPHADLHIIPGMGHGMPSWAHSRLADLIAEHVLRQEPSAAK